MNEEKRIQRLENQVLAIHSCLSTLLTVLIALCQSLMPESPQITRLYSLREALKSIKPGNR